MKLKSLTLLAGVLLIACTLNATTRFGLLDSTYDMTVNITSISGITKAVKNTSLGNLWNDQAIQNALGKHDLKKSLTKSMFEGASEEERHIYLEMFKMLKGSFAVAVDISNTNYSLVASISEEDYKRSITMNRRLSEITANKYTIHKQRYRGVDIYAEIHATNTSENTWSAYIDNTLMVSSSDEWIKKSITKIKNSPITEAKQPAPGILVNININSIIKKAIKKMDEDSNKQDSQAPGASISPTKIFDSMGVLGVKKLSFNVFFHKDRIVADSSLAIEKPLKGILKMIDLTPSPLNLRVPYAPDSIIGYEVSRINLLALWNEIPTMIDQIAPPEQASKLKTGLYGAAAMLGADPGRDIFANLDTQWINITVDSKPEPQSLYLVRLKNEAALQSALEKIFAETSVIRMQLGEAFKEESFRDAKLYELNMGVTNSTPIGISAEAGFLAVGPAQIVRQYLRATDSGNPANQAFYKSRNFADLCKNTPSDAIAYNTFDIGKYVKSALSMVLDNPAMKMAHIDKTVDENNPFPNFDAEKLPSAEYISKFFGASFGHVIESGNAIKSRTVIYYGKK